MPPHLTILPRILPSFQNVPPLLLTTRLISTTPTFHAKKMPDRPPPIAESEFTESFLKGSGPGGQKINKTSSAVQLKHLPTGLVLKVQATRSRSQNRKLARQMLAERLEVKEKGEECRVAVVGDVKRRRKASAGKKARRKYRALEDGGEGIEKEGKGEERKEEAERRGDEDDARRGEP